MASHQAVLLEGVAEANAWPIMGYYSGPHANYSANAFLYPLVTMKSRLDRQESQKATVSASDWAGGKFQHTFLSLEDPI